MKSSWAPAVFSMKSEALMMWTSAYRSSFSTRGRPRVLDARRDRSRAATRSGGGPPIDRDVVQLVAEAGSSDEAGAHVVRHGDEEVEGHLPLVVGDQDPALAVDVLDHEVRLDEDRPYVEHPAEVLGRDGLVKAPSRGVT